MPEDEKERVILSTFDIYLLADLLFSIYGANGHPLQPKLFTFAADIALRQWCQLLNHLSRLSEQVKSQVLNLAVNSICDLLHRYVL